MSRLPRFVVGFVAALSLWACSSTPESAPLPSRPPSAAASASLGGGGSWPAYHRDAARSGVSADQQALGRVRRAWASPELDGDVYAQPLIVGGTVFVATEGNGVYALEASSGRIVWRRSLGRPVPANALPCGNIDPSGIT